MQLRRLNLVTGTAFYRTLKAKISTELLATQSTELQDLFQSFNTCKEERGEQQRSLRTNARPLQQLYSQALLAPIHAYSGATTSKVRGNGRKS